MASYLVLLPPEPDRNPESARFIRDGFSWFAFLLPLVWMLWHRMWLYALLFFAVELVLGLLAGDAGDGMVAGVIQLALGILVGLESAEIRLRHLLSRHHTVDAIVEATDLDEAEAIYFSESGTETRPVAAMPALPPSTPMSAKPPSHAPVLGLIDYGKGR